MVAAYIKIIVVLVVQSVSWRSLQEIEKMPETIEIGDNRVDADNVSISSDVVCRYVIDRPAHSEAEFEQKISGPEIKPDPPAIGDRARKCVERCTCKNALQVIAGLFPIFTWMRHYDIRQWLPGDIVSGLTVGVVHIPQSMAFSLLAGLPPVFGLYTSLYPVILYTLMGTSRHISVGTFAITSLLTQSVVLRVVPDEPVLTTIAPTNVTSTMTTQAMVSNIGISGVSDIEARRVAVASALMLLMGVFQLAFGMLRLGFITTYLSEPLIQAFTTGAALHVIVSQTPSVLGIKIQSVSGVGAFFRNWVEIFRNLPNTHVPTLIISIVCMFLLIVGREINIRYKEKMKVPIPTEVIVVIIATISSHFGMFQEDFGVVIVDNIPTGLPAPQLPNTSVMGEIIGDAFAVAIVGFAISVSLAKLYAQKYGYSIDANQELIAYGVSNIIPSFFLCFPNAAALARCVIQENTGGKTQVVGIISVVIVLITILVLGPLFEPLPRAVLGCIIIVGLFGIVKQFEFLKPIYKMSKVDFLIWIVTLAAVLILGVDIGLLAGVVFSMFTVIIRTQMPKCEVLGSVGGTDIYRSCHGYLSAVPYSGIVIFKFHSVLYYANRDFFKKKLFKATGVDPDVVIAEKKKAAAKRAIQKNNRENPGYNCCSFGRRRKFTPNPVITIDDETASSSVHQSDSFEKGADKERELFHTVVIDCAAITFIDLVGIKTLKALCSSFKEIGVSMLLANVSGDVRCSLTVGGYYEIAGSDSEFVSVHDAAVFAQYKK